MKKLTRKLFVSLMTLVLTAMALGTSTFAWFSMNTTANATNMTVTAKSNATYLLIGTGSDNTAALIQGKATPQISVVAAKSDGTDNNNRYPVAFNGTASTKTVGGASIGANHWYTASNQYSDASTSSVQNGSDLGLTFTGDQTPTYNTALQNYVVKYTVYLTLSRDSESYTTDKFVKITFSKGTDDNKGGNDNAMAAVVKVGDNYYKLDGDSTSVLADDAPDHVYLHLPADLTSGTVQQVDIFIYINGESANVNSNFFNTQGNTLTGTVGIQFDLTFGTGA